MPTLKLFAKYYYFRACKRQLKFRKKVNLFIKNYFFQKKFKFFSIFFFCKTFYKLNDFIVIKTQSAFFKLKLWKSKIGQLIKKRKSIRLENFKFFYFLDTYRYWLTTEQRFDRTAANMETINVLGYLSKIIADLKAKEKKSKSFSIYYIFSFDFF